MVVEVADTYNLNYAVFYMIGVCTHVSKNFFITAIDYWMYKFRNTALTDDEIRNAKGRTDLQAEFISTFSVIANAVNYIFVVIAMVLGRKINLEKQIMWAISVMLVCFVLTMVFVDINTDKWQREFMIYQLCVGGLLTAACGVLTVNTFQISVKFPPEYLVACMSGHSVCGIASAVIQITCLSMSDLGSQIVAFAYFSIGLIFVFLTIFGFLGIKYYSKFYKYHSTKEIAPKKTSSDEKTETLFIRVKRVIFNIKWYMIGLYLGSSVTVALEPGVTSLIVSEGAGQGNKWNDVFFVPVTTFLFFHFFDWLGRESARRIQKPKDGRLIVVVSIIRIIFVPLFMYCNLHPRHNLPVLFQNDWTYILLIITLAYTTGYIVISSVYHAGRISSDEDRQITSNITLLTMVATVLSFSSLSIVIVKLL